MIRTLFLKIFFWFWLAMALVVGAIVVATVMAPSDPTAPGRSMMSNVLPFISETAANTLEGEGSSALTNYLNRLEQTAHIRAVMFNRQGEEVSGRPLPAPAKGLVARVLQSGKVEFKFSGRTTVVAQEVFGSHHDPYIFVAELRRGPLDRIAINPRQLVLRLIAVLMTTGILCYGLARYLTAPITRVRTATRQLASGDLTARAGSTVAHRHDELADLARDFDLMAERLQSLLGAQRALLSDVSHELRSPLARLNVALELARRRAGAEARGALDRIERESQRLNTLIGQLLTLARLESGAQGQERVPIDLAELVRDIGVDADFEARSRNCAVKILIKEACETMGVPELLRSAVENIVRNAVRYTAQGTEVEITLGCHGDGANSQAVICVRDRGPGVPEATLAHLFRPFYRVTDARDRQSGGAGLGLAIAERALRVHGGRITATNAPDGGLIVVSYLPATARESA